ncbi:hypothetical protein MUB04_14415 [Acinetobacter indicus]|uniref:hypothetical protein n=1 Tax=Acinetobacter TaxID=469 RepID=UPI0015D41180|nr:MULTISPECIES: hypothetical protein [Acinetobacter]MCP0917725.1 hypothetical protein [Acinetobacter indicus]
MNGFLYRDSQISTGKSCNFFLIQIHFLNFFKPGGVTPDAKYNDFKEISLELRRMKNTNQSNLSIQQLMSDHEKKVQRTSMLFSLMSTLTTILQINTILSILMAMIIPFALNFLISDYVIILLSVVFGFLVGISFAVVLIQKYINKLIQLNK